MERQSLTMTQLCQSTAIAFPLAVVIVGGQAGAERPPLAEEAFG